MVEPWDDLKDAAVGIVKDALKGFVERQEVDEFVRRKAQDYAREWWGSVHAATEDERSEHAANLGHLKAQVKAEFDRLQIAISVDAKNTVIKILETVGGVLIKLAPKILAAV